MGVEPQTNSSGSIADRNSIEILQRAKRLETKVSKLMERMGYGDEAGEACTWDNGSVKVPTSEVSMRRILDVIPHDWNIDVLVIRGREVIATIRR